MTTEKTAQKTEKLVIERDELREQNARLIDEALMLNREISDLRTQNARLKIEALHRSMSLIDLLRGWLRERRRTERAKRRMRADDKLGYTYTDEQAV